MGKGKCRQWELSSKTLTGRRRVTPTRCPLTSSLNLTDTSDTYAHRVHEITLDDTGKWSQTGESEREKEKEAEKCKEAKGEETRARPS